MFVFPLYFELALTASFMTVYDAVYKGVYQGFPTINGQRSPKCHYKKCVTPML